MALTHGASLRRPSPCIVLLVASILVSGCAVAPIPLETQVPKLAVTPLDGKWRLAEVPGVIYHVERGRMFVPLGTLVVPPNGVVVRDIRQTGPGTYEGFDLYHRKPWRATVQEDGNVHIEAVGAARYTMIAIAVADTEWFDAQRAADRILPRPGQVPAGPIAASGFGNYHALVIGNDNYRHLAQLRTARADAEAVGALLAERYGFTVETLYDANREQILVAFTELRKRLRPDDNLLIYYAGHGWLDEAADEGYWLPVDATADNDVRWISNATITAHFRAIEAKHVLVVADSCFSGTLTRGIRISTNTPSDLERMSKRKARIVLSSGGEEPVSDGTGAHSAFATEFLRALRANDGILDTTSLYAQIRRPVMLASDQDPDLADIRKAGHDGGDFLFVPQD